MENITWPALQSVWNAREKICFEEPAIRYHPKRDGALWYKFHYISTYTNYNAYHDKLIGISKG